MAAWTVPATVVRIIDADTILAELQLGWMITLRNNLRLWGVNAPENSTPEGKAATAYVKGLLNPGDAIGVVSHRLLGQTDKYGRTLASVTLHDGRDLSTTLVDTGHAVPYMTSELR